MKTKSDWIPIEDKLPETDDYILISFENFSLPSIGRYEANDEGGAFYDGDSDKSCSSYGLFVNAWMPLPERYKKDEYPEMPGQYDNMTGSMNLHP